MSIFAMFADRMVPVSVEGKKNELAIITRRGKTIDPQVIQNERMCTLQDDTAFASGDLMRSDSDKYYIVAQQASRTGAVQAHLRRVNAAISIARLTPIYNQKKNKIGEKETILFKEIPTVQYTVSANMKLYDAGLLPGSVKKYILPELGVQLQDRIKVDGNNYEIIGINNDKYSNILEVQCSLDTRKVMD